MAYSFDDAGADERHTTQYFEMFCNRGIYHQGWTAVTKHGVPWMLVGQEKPALDDDVWELYDTTTDWTQARNLAAEQPEKLAELQRLFLIEATKYNVLPLDDRTAERLMPELAGRPTLVQGRPAAALRRHGAPVRELGRQHQEQVARRHRRDRGPRRRRGGRDHRPGRQHRRLEPLPQGRQAALLLQPPRDPALLRRRRQPRCRPALTRCAWSSTTRGPGSARAATSRFTSTESRLGEGTVAATAAMVFSADDTCDVGQENGALVAEDYPVPNTFTGEVNWVEIDVGSGSSRRRPPPRRRRAPPGRDGEAVDVDRRSGRQAGDVRERTSAAASTRPGAKPLPGRGRRRQTPRLRRRPNRPRVAAPGRAATARRPPEAPSHRRRSRWQPRARTPTPGRRRPRMLQPRTPQSARAPVPRIRPRREQRRAQRRRTPGLWRDSRGAPPLSARADRRLRAPSGGPRGSAAGRCPRASGRSG